MGLVSGGGLADRVAAHEDHLLLAPAGLEEQQVAALPEALITGYDALTQLSCQMGDIVAIRGINGGVGLATAQIAKALGARVLGIGRSTAIVERVRQLRIDACTHEEFAERAQDLGGLDAVVELIGGEFVRDDLAALRLLGRIVVVSVAGGPQCAVPLNVMMGKRARIMGTVLRSRSDAEKSTLFANARKQLGGLLDTQQLAMPVDRVFPAARVADAFDHLAGPGKLGKVLLDFHNAS
ncbi:zinc-binding dehydrogenase [Mesorhizobium sp. DCY119]|uniref:zinc-binding dehydrogenase n=1 Tax=Mesorhizobium sp. DCY119 TaxID=2108445 RepID=UPI001FE219D0|nr:zinc-binding dehydrogenase [Mesorhizobium sp. DCY119]